MTRLEIKPRRRCAPDACLVLSFPFLAFLWLAGQLQAGTVTEPLQYLGIHMCPPDAAAATPDGSKVVTVNVCEQIVVWDTATQQPLMEIDTTPYELNWALDVSPDGTMVLVGGRDGLATLWSLETGEFLNAFRTDVSTIEAVAFTPSGTAFLTAGNGAKAQLWDLSSGDLVQEYDTGSFWIPSAAFSADGSQLLLGTMSAEAQLWDVETGDRLDTFALRGNDVWVHSVSFAPDGSTVMAASSNLYVWDTGTGNLTLDWTPPSGWGVRSAIHTANGNGVIAGEVDGRVHVLSLTTGNVVRTIQAGDAGSVFTLALMPQQNRVLATGNDYTTRVLNTQLGTVAAMYGGGHIWPVSSVAYSPSGARAISGDEQGKAVIWNLGTGLGTLLFAEHEAPIQSVAFSPQGNLVASGDEAGVVHIWNSTNGNTTARLEHDGERPVVGLFFVPGAEEILTATPDGVFVWDIARETVMDSLILEVARKGEGGLLKGVTAMAVSSPGDWIAIGLGNGDLALFGSGDLDLPPVFARAHDGAIASLAASPDGTRLVSGGLDGVARVWDVTAGTPGEEGLLQELQESDAVPVAVAFHPAGRRVLTGSMDGGTTGKGARVWNIDTGALERTFELWSYPFRALAFSPDGSRFIAGSDWGLNTVWESGIPFHEISPVARALGDLNEDGCINFQDFLFLLEQWGTPFDGTPIGFTDFLALLEHWDLCYL